MMDEMRLTLLQLGEIPALPMVTDACCPMLSNTRRVHTRTMPSSSD